MLTRQIFIQRTYDEAIFFYLFLAKINYKVDEKTGNVYGMLDKSNTYIWH